MNLGQIDVMSTMQHLHQMQDIRTLNVEGVRHLNPSEYAEVGTCATLLGKP